MIRNEAETVPPRPQERPAAPAVQDTADDHRQQRAERLPPHVNADWPHVRRQERPGASSGPWSNQSNHAVPSVTYMPITRPVKPVATSVDRYLPSSSASGSGSVPTWKATKSGAATCRPDSLSSPTDHFRADLVVITRTTGP